MACILNIETSTDVCSVAVSENGACIFDEEDHSGPNHAVKLGVFVDEALSFTDNHAIPFDAVAVSCGPGSYTGLRIGVSMAKGICYARDLKLIAVPTLELLCVPVLLRELVEEGALLCPMIDARRMEVYTAVYSAEGERLTPVEAQIVGPESFAAYLDRGEVLFVGDGALKCQEVIGHPNARFKEAWPFARDMAKPAQKAFEEGEFENLAYFEPFYLKDFVATVSKKKLW